ncbi:glycoside hydrolase family 31 protein [Xylariaceae sp. AK1471]|nr:glycoside hydrolase family 31 protein [Xylariaceae sp. AK1471]
MPSVCGLPKKTRCLYKTRHFNSHRHRSRKFQLRMEKPLSCHDQGASGNEDLIDDEAEPEYAAYDFDNYRYHGTNVNIGSIYPRDYARAFYEGMEAVGQRNIIKLFRCASVSSQKYGALVWSGNIASSWSSLRNHLAAGLNMGIAGFPWRLHGDREPKQPQHGTTGGATCLSVYEICKKYMLIREDIRNYTRKLMRVAHEKGTLFYEFQQDKKCWEVGSSQYMYGDKYLCCPVLEPGIRKLIVSLPTLPEGDEWACFDDNKTLRSGGESKEVDCPMETMSVFVRKQRSG